MQAGRRDPDTGYELSPFLFWFFSRVFISYINNNNNNNYTQPRQLGQA